MPLQHKLNKPITRCYFKKKYKKIDICLRSRNTGLSRNKRLWIFTGKYVTFCHYSRTTNIKEQWPNSPNTLESSDTCVQISHYRTTISQHKNNNCITKRTESNLTVYTKNDLSYSAVYDQDICHIILMTLSSSWADPFLYIGSGWKDFTDINIKGSSVWVF